MSSPRLVATAWTSAGNVSPMDVPATSPVPVAERIAAVRDAGYTGMGLVASTFFRALPVHDALKLAAESAFSVLRPETRLKSRT